MINEIASLRSQIGGSQNHKTNLTLHFVFYYLDFRIRRNDKLIEIFTD